MQQQRRQHEVALQTAIRLPACLLLPFTNTRVPHPPSLPADLLLTPHGYILLRSPEQWEGAAPEGEGKRGA